MPNRRRRRLSTAMSAIAALAVTSPFAYVAVSELTSDMKPAPEHREFVRAAVMEDLPNELIPPCLRVCRSSGSACRPSRA